MKVKFAICNEIYTERNVFEAIEYSSKLGYDGVELAPFTFADDVFSFSVDEQKSIGRCASDNGVEIMGLHWLLLKPEGLSLTSADEKVRQKTFDVFSKLIEINANVGGRIMTLGSPRQRVISEEEDRQSVIRQTVDFFQGLGPDLQASGVILAMEPLEDDFTNFLVSTEETRAVVEQIGLEGFGITLDTHFLRWESERLGVSIAEIFRQAGSSLVHLHIQDENRLAPGMGSYDFSEFLQAIKKIGWDGYISMETFTRERTGVDGEVVAERGMKFFIEHFG